MEWMVLPGAASRALKGRNPGDTNQTSTNKAAKQKLVAQYFGEVQ